MRPFNAAMVPKPGSESSVFPKTEMPIDVDCGCGVGWHVLQRAQKYSDRYVIGIEHTAAKFHKFSRRIERHPHLANVMGIHANAISWFTHVVPDESIDQIFFMYPNPNPKSSQANKRWHNMGFMDLLISKLKPAGRIFLSSNEQWYVEEARKSFTIRNHLIITGYGELPEASRENPRTHFEAKYMDRGESCYQLELARRPS